MATVITLPSANDVNWNNVLNTAITTVRDATDAEVGNRNTAIASQHTADVAAFDASGAAATAQANAIADAATRYMKTTHMVSSGGSPTIAAGPAAGTAPSAVTVAGTDTAFTVAITAGAASSAGVILTVTFTAAWAAAPRVFLQPKNAATAGGSGSVSQVFASTTTTTASLSSGGALVAGTVYSWDVFIVA